MRVVLTGGAGFIGHHLAARLVGAGHDVVVFDNFRRGSMERPGLHGVPFIEGDVRDPGALRTAFAGAGAVVHLAAQSNVMGSEADPGYTYETNVAGTWNVAMACRATGVGHLIFASSREVYGDPETLPVAEETPVAPKNLYGASKAAGELLLRSGFAEAPGVSVLRLANVIGRGDAGRVIPLWLRAAQAGEPLRVFGGKQTLDLVPVAFVCDVVERLLEAGPIDGPLNVGSGTSTSILDLARLITRITGSASPIEVVPPRGPEVTHFSADTNRLRQVLGLQPPAEPLSSIEADW